MAKRKLTEGVLARDRKRTGSFIVFLYTGEGYPPPVRRDFCFNLAGLCQQKLALAWTAAYNEEWSEEEWLAAGYSKADIPRRGSAYECFLEL